MRLHPRRNIVIISAARSRIESDNTSASKSPVTTAAAMEHSHTICSMRKTILKSSSTTSGGFRHCAVESADEYLPRIRTRDFSSFGTTMIAVSGNESGSPWKWKESILLCVISVNGRTPALAVMEVLSSVFNNKAGSVCGLTS